MRTTGVIVGAVIAVVGAIFTLQGIGLIKGSFMSNTVTWSILGPIIAIAGVTYSYRAARAKDSRR